MHWATLRRHSDLFWAATSTSSQVIPILNKSLLTVLWYEQRTRGIILQLLTLVQSSEHACLYFVMRRPILSYVTVMIWAELPEVNTWLDGYIDLAPVIPARRPSWMDRTFRRPIFVLANDRYGSRSLSLIMQLLLPDIALSAIPCILTSIMLSCPFHIPPFPPPGPSRDKQQKRRYAFTTLVGTICLSRII